jgi:hypothetical protein
MRRPALTRAQRLYAIEQRRLLQLRRACVRLMLAIDGGKVDDQAHELEVSALAYANSLSAKDRRRLSK